MKKFTKIYVFHCPVQEIWEMEVEANSKEEAWERVKNNDWHQTCSFSGSTKSGKTELVEVKEIKDES